MSHLQLQPFNKNKSSWNQDFKFEYIDTNELRLIVALSSLVNTFENGIAAAQSFLGLIPQNSVINKFPFYKYVLKLSEGMHSIVFCMLERDPSQLSIEKNNSCRTAASSNSSIRFLSKDLEWLLSTEKKIEKRKKENEELNASSTPPTDTVFAQLPSQQSIRPQSIRQGRKKYARDSLTIPAMVAVYNVLLVWVLFNIDIRASSL